MAGREIKGVRIKLASPERIRELSSGEVKKPETINYRTLRPEKDGLFCERIFGPTKSYECACGKYKRSGPKFKGVVCDRCGVEVTDNRVRRERMGHIELAAPVVHIWYLRGIPSRLSLLLGTSTKDLEKVVYFAPTRRREVAYKVVMEGKRPDLLKRGTVISESELRIHSHYDSKVRAEEAYRIVSVDDLPLNEGDVLKASQVARYKTDYGESVFRVEPAFLIKKAPENLKHGEEDFIAQSELLRLRDLGMDIEAERGNVGKQEAFVVTAAAHLPFSKGDIISTSEFQLFHEKYPGRFMAQIETITIEDPCYIVNEPSNSAFEQAQIILEREQELCSAYDKKFKAGIGAEGVHELLDGIDLDFLASALREELSDATGQKKRKIIKRLQVAEDFRQSAFSPKSMVLEVLPVIPPDLRPMVQLDGGRFATSDLNDLYRRVINRNNRLRKLQELRAPEIIIRNEKRMLQESVDALIDNGRMGKAVLGAGNRPLKSLTDLLRGKKGRFRQNLLGKRVDYSGRSVIVIGPELKIYQCGLPKQMALELFKPFVIRQLVEQGLAPNVKSAKRLIERGREEIWGILEEIIRDHPVMLNRAPTLHRLGIQAFEPVLMEGKAIRLHPMVCSAFNADFDGDQMAVHVPLSIEAQAEARMLMLSAANLLSPASGKPVVTPTQDIVLGIYYLTAMKEGLEGDGRYFLCIEDALSAYDHGGLNIQSRVYLRNKESWNCDTEGKWIETSIGRIVFNSNLHEKLKFINKQLKKKDIGKLIDEAYDTIDRKSIVEMLDAIKHLGYHWSTVSGLSLGVQSVIIPPQKTQITDDTLETEDELKSQFDMGILTEDEYLREKENLWSEASREIADNIVNNMSMSNPVKQMIESGARGSKSQVAQMAGIRGLMSDPSGRIIDYPITANFREGLNMLEYFISTHGARKGLADTALRTAKSGYLTRRLVDVSQDIIVTDSDCGTDKGVKITALSQDDKIMIPIRERIVGRTVLNDVTHPVTGEILVPAGEYLTSQMATKLEEAGIEEVWVRSPMTCELKHGVCQKCYGMDLATRGQVAVGEAVGVVAAQSIGEPGTQLTMRTFHTGGVRLTGEDITQGLPRIEQLFEARRPKKVAYLAGLNGKVHEIREMEGKRKVIITSDEDGQDRKVTYNIPTSQSLLVEEGQEVTKMTRLTEGYVDPQQLLEVDGIVEVQKMLVDEIQSVYMSQGVAINNKHIEVILRKVAPVNRMRVVDEGDTSLVAGQLVWSDEIEEEKRQIQQENEENIQEAVEIFSGKVLQSASAAKGGEGGSFEDGTVLDEKTIRRILKPGSMMHEVTVVDDEGPLDVIIGEATFRKQLEGMELIYDHESSDGKVVSAGVPLTHGQIAIITSDGPRPVLVRNVEALEKLVDNAYLADDIVAEGEVVAKADTLISSETLEVLKECHIPSIKIWKHFEEVHVPDALQERLINQIWGKPLSQAIDSEGNSVDEVNHMVDGKVVRSIIEGEYTAVEIDGEIITRGKLIADYLSEAVYGKVILDPVMDREGNIVAESGQEINREILEKLAEAGCENMVLRHIYAHSEEKMLIQRVTFMRKLRIGPECKPFVHGITKAALATDSFLSAASFQQTAQVLAGAAVKGQTDDLKGLKENVIIGHLIPAGTGVKDFREADVKVVRRSEAEAEPVLDVMQEE